MTYQPTKSDIAYEGVYLANGIKAIGRGKDASYRVFQFTECGHIQQIKKSNASRFNFKCHACFDEKLNKEAYAVGLKLLDRIDGINAAYKFLGCGHEQIIQVSSVREGRFHCRICQEKKLHTEAKAIGLDLLEIFVKKAQSCGLYRVIECGHEQEATLSNVRNGRFRCKACLQDKHLSEAKQAGVEYIEKIDKNLARYKFIECGHEQTIEPSKVRLKIFRCQTCNDTWVNKPSNLYLHKIEYGTNVFLKFGRAMNVERRSMQYGLPVGTVLTVLATWPTKTGIEADKIETLISKQFNLYSKSKAKLVLQDSGWTECFNVEDEEAIIAFVEGQLS
jgi:hypothetical protein